MPLSKNNRDNRGSWFDVSKILEYIKDYPLILGKFLINPFKESAEIPVEEVWEKPISYIAVSILLLVLFNGFYNIPDMISVFTAISYVFRIFIYVFLLVFFAGLLGRRPGYYRTLYFISVSSSFIVIAHILFVVALFRIFDRELIFTYKGMISIKYAGVVIKIFYLYLLWGFFSGAALCGRIWGFVFAFLSVVIEEFFVSSILPFLKLTMEVMLRSL